MDPITMMAISTAVSGLVGGLSKKKGGGGEESGGGGGGGGTTAPTSAPTGGNIMPGGANPGMAAGMGIAQLVQGGIQRKKAERLQPTLEDPQQVLAMQEYERRANNAMTGAGVSNSMRNLKQSQAGAYRALARSGNVGQYGALSRNLAQEQNELLAQGQQTEMGYRKMFDTMLNTVADRRLRLQSKKADAMSLRAESNIAGGTQNTMAGLAMMGGAGKPNTGGGTTGGAGGGTPAYRNYSGVGGADSPNPMNMEEIEAMGSAPIAGFGGMPIPGM